VIGFVWGNLAQVSLVFCSRELAGLKDRVVARSLKYDGSRSLLE